MSFPGNDEDPSSLSRKKVRLVTLPHVYFTIIIFPTVESVVSLSSGERNRVLHLVTASLCFVGHLSAGRVSDTVHVLVVFAWVFSGYFSPTVQRLSGVSLPARVSGCLISLC